jgi:GNAT superfamily N-acetyltransferase
MRGVRSRPPTLRRATNADASGVADVLLASRKAFLPYAPLAHTDAALRRWVADVLVPSGGVTVACDGATVVGVLAVSRNDGATWIDQLYVAPTRVGQGVGSGLLRTVLPALGRPVRLHTFQANRRARRFYEAHGFTAVEFRDGSANEEQCPDVLYELAPDDPT